MPGMKIKERSAPTTLAPPPSPLENRTLPLPQPIIPSFQYSIIPAFPLFVVHPDRHLALGRYDPARTAVRVKPPKSPMFSALGTTVRVWTPGDTTCP
jgi:hypothetical protein